MAARDGERCPSIIDLRRRAKKKKDLELQRAGTKFPIEYVRYGSVHGPMATCKFFFKKKETTTVFLQGCEEKKSDAYKLIIV